MKAPVAAVIYLLISVGSSAQEEQKVDFVRDIQPIIKASCLECHGAKGKPKGQLRLDAKSWAMKGGVSGKVIVPGNARESFLVKLLQSTDPDERMPRKAPALSAAQIDLFARWINQGAAWPDSASADVKLQKHWAYVMPVRPPTPTVRNAAWVRNPIDAFILARLEREGLSPSPEASKETLLRRVSFDLIGLPPSIEEIEAFLADASPDAYDKVVDRLLDSPHYGERWARAWLDLARYADTNGFNFDSRRTMWRYREWVIHALNRDMPFPQFTLEQIAGDMLPNATLEQKIATGFHRNTMTNEEGGVDKDEARWETLLDRVNTTGAVWLGSTLACAQCHNHKYDPFSQKEFYQFLAFFESSDEPRIELLTPEQEADRRALRARIAQDEKAFQGIENLALPTHVKTALGIAFEKRTNTQRNDVVIYCRSQMPHSHEAGAQLLDLYKAHEKLEAATALVLKEKSMKEAPQTYFRIKGGFTNVGEKVTAGVPSALHPLPEGARPDRLALGRWLADEENPLVARVTVNRFWDQIFGRPILETPEDFGSQAQSPTHPELLDWLATEFVRLGWSMKKFHRTLVTSAAYRQSSRVTPALHERDPYNKLLARGPRFRLEAEAIRDGMLVASGLLSRKIGGPSVFPLQADMSGVIAINKVDTGWAPSAGEDRYRRGLYTHWRRTAPYAAFMTFDAPSRESCAIRRPRTNTPLQALSGLNDPSFFDASQGLARRIMSEAAAPRDRAALAFRLCTARRPDSHELDRILKAYERELAHFGKNEKAARAVAGGANDPAEAAAWTMIANVILNLDETLTKE